MKKYFFVLCFVALTLNSAQVIKKTINNNVVGFQIVDDKGEYFLPVDNADINLPILQQRNKAVEKYNAIKLQEAQPVVPSTKELLNNAYLKELGSVEDQLEMIYQDMLNGTHVWIEKRTEIKNKLQPIK